VRIDAHVHLWDEQALGDYYWMTDEMAAIRRPFGVDELTANLDRHGFDCAILVQTRPSVDETRAYLELADRHEAVGGVVGWVDLTDGAVADMLAELREGRGGEHLVGIRHQVHDEEDAEWLLRADVRRGLETVADAGLVYDLLVRTRELPAASAALAALPELPVVLDHIAKPPIASDELEPWAERLARLADLDQVVCKLSGLVTEADWHAWRPEDVRPYAERVLDAFGEERLLFGSDWPVCTVAAAYDDVVALAEDVVGASVAVFGATAARVYRLP
jgi:L-fucono-1,5-lactonase